MSRSILSTAEESRDGYIVIIGTKLTRMQATALKNAAGRRNLTVSALVRQILLEWSGNPVTPVMPPNAKWRF